MTINFCLCLLFSCLRTVLSSRLKLNYLDIKSGCKKVSDDFSGTTMIEPIIGQSDDHIQKMQSSLSNRIEPAQHLKEVANRGAEHSS